MDKMVITQTFTMARWQIVVKKQHQQNNKNKQTNKLNKLKQQQLYIQKTIFWQ